MALSIQETDEGRKITGYLAGDNSWLLPGEEIIRFEMIQAYNLPLPNFADMPFYGSTQYIACTSYKPLIMSGPHTLVMKDYVKSVTSTNSSDLLVGSKSPVGRSLTSKPKTGGINRSYKPKKGARCAPGFRLLNGICVKQ